MTDPEEMASDSAADGPPAEAVADDTAIDDERSGEPPAGRLALWSAAVVGVIVLLLIVLLATAEGGSDQAADTRLMGEVAPLVAGETLTGERYDLDDLRGQWVLVNFFQTTCIPCVREHPELIEFSEQHAERGDASVVSVVFDDTTAAVADFFETNGGDWPVLVGDTDRIALEYGVIAVPESYLVAPNGLVVWKGIGGVTAAGIDDVITTLGGGA